MSAHDMSQKITAESLLGFLLGTALDPNQKLSYLRRWAEEQCKAAAAPEPVKPQKPKKSSQKAA